jgi:hypothetical protein
VADTNQAETNAPCRGTDQWMELHEYNMQQYEQLTAHTCPVVSGRLSKRLWLNR